MATFVRAWVRRSRGVEGAGGGRRPTGVGGGARIERVELWMTPDLVAFPPPSEWGEGAGTLLNPANEQLCGTRFTPSEANTAFPGTGLIYPEQVIDGRVTEFGGSALRAILDALPTVEAGGIKCRVGEAVGTPTAGELRGAYAWAVHTVPPLWGGGRAGRNIAGGVGVGGEVASAKAEWERLLRSCYTRAFELAWEGGGGGAPLAAPLLGAGARGAPPDEAAAVAARVAVGWLGGQGPGPGGGRGRVLQFGTNDDHHAAAIEDAFDETWGRTVSLSDASFFH